VAESSKTTLSGQVAAFIGGLVCLFLAVLAIDQSIALRKFTLCRVTCIEGYPAAAAIGLLVLIGIWLTVSGKRGMRHLSGDGA
jgi:hypothetical protein